MIEGVSSKTELLEKTLCPLVEGAAFHKFACVKRECSSCGVASLKKQFLDAAEVK